MPPSITRSFLAFLLLAGIALPARAQFFAFDFKGPDTLLADPGCQAILTLDMDSLSVQALVGASVTDTVLTILGGFSLGDPLVPGDIVTFEWTATDNLGNDSTFVFTITVIDGTPPDFSIALPPDITVTCPNIPNLPAVSAIDNCDAQPTLAFTETNTLASCAGSYTITRRWVASDDAGNSRSHQQVITVLDMTPPVLNGVPADVTVNCNNIPAPPLIGMDITATDACDNSPTITLTTQNNTGGCTHEFGIVRIWTATDDCGNATTGSQMISAWRTRPDRRLSVRSARACPPIKARTPGMIAARPPSIQMRAASRAGVRTSVSTVDTPRPKTTAVARGFHHIDVGLSIV